MADGDVRRLPLRWKVGQMVRYAKMVLARFSLSSERRLRTLYAHDYPE